MDEGCLQGDYPFLPCLVFCLVCPPEPKQGADAVPSGFTTPIPSELLTPDQVRTSVGTFNFFDGMPDAATVKSSFEHLKFIRAYETFLTLMPAASIEMLRAWPCADRCG